MIWMGETQQNRLLGCDLDHLGTGIIVFGITILNQALDVCFSFDHAKAWLDVRPARNALKPVRGKSNDLIHNSTIMLTQRTLHGRRVLDVQLGDQPCTA